MRKLLCDLWRDENGCVPAMEWMMVASILTLGIVVSALALHHADERDDEEPAALVR